ncbi:MAG: M48 family metalloprotease [Planctomycetota bacterium]|nr:M48 family metalloprotease [Planctomycetota bacterium]
MGAFFYAILGIFVLFANPYPLSFSRPPALETVVSSLIATVLLVSGAYLASKRIRGEGQGAINNLFSLKRRWLFLNLLVLGVNGHLFGLVPLLAEILPAIMREFAIVLVFFIQTSMVLAAVSDAEIRARALSVSRRAYVLFHLRQFFVAAAPFLFFSAFIQSVEQFSKIEEALFIFPSLSFLPVSLIILVMFSLFPLGLCFMFPYERMKEGIVRTLLFHLAGREGVKIRDVMVWKTGVWRIVNAAVSGLFGRLRYVFVTDTVLNFPEEEVCAVFAHELGHSRMHHPTLYMSLALSFVGVTLFLDRILQGLDLDYQVLLFAGVVVLFWFVLFGYISRRFEQAADVYAAGLVGEKALSQALLRIFSFTGRPREKVFAWRHFPLEKRVRLLDRLQENPSYLHTVVKETRKAVALLTLLVVTGFGLYIYCAYMDASKPEDEVLFLRAEFAAAKGEYEQALGFAEKALEYNPGSERLSFFIEDLRRKVKGE